MFWTIAGVATQAGLPVRHGDIRAAFGMLDPMAGLALLGAVRGMPETRLDEPVLRDAERHDAPRQVIALPRRLALPGHGDEAAVGGAAYGLLVPAPGGTSAA